jgi:molecular chaperone HscB
VDPFETLGIAPAFDVDMGALEKRQRDLSRVLHPDRHVTSSPAERRMSLSRAVEVNEAFRIVKDPIRRAEALLRQRGVEVKEGAEPKADPEFLMEMMELREALSAVKAGGDRAGIERLSVLVRGKQETALERLGEGFARTSEPGSSPRNGTLQKLVPVLGELRFYRRFLDEVSAIDDLAAEEASK